MHTTQLSVPTDDLAPAERLECAPVDDPTPPPTAPPTARPTAPPTDPPAGSPTDPPADPPLVPPSVPFVLDRREAARLLSQATLGPTLAEIDALVDLGSIDAWIAAQIAQPMSRTLPYVRANSNGSLRSTRHHIWWANAVDGPDQLRQRIAFALSEIFVVSDRDYELGNAQYGICNYFDMLAEHAFGNFRTLLEQVTLHPVMGIYLSMLRNERADPERNIRPDENYAREVLQLFTIGLYELDPDGTVRVDAAGDAVPTYDQSTIEEFAKVFTGWNLADATAWVSNDLTSYDKEQPMVPVEEYHDTSEKELLNGTRLPAGQSARADLDAALDNIFEHANVGPFIARALIVRLVTSNPTPAYVGRVAAVFDDDGSGVRGNLEAVVTAILLDSEARSGHVTMPARFGKIVEPMIRLTRVWRAFGARPGPDADGVFRSPAGGVDQLDEAIGQGPLRSPSVFNFFSPDHPLTSGSDLRAPEAQVLSEIGVATTNNLLHAQIYGANSQMTGSGSVALIDIDTEPGLAGNGLELVEHLDVLLTSGALPREFIELVAAHVDSLPDDADGMVTRVVDAIFCVVGSPFHLVQK